MNFKLKKNGIYFFSLLTCLMACHDKEVLKRALIEKTVKNKVDSHQRKKTLSCQEEAMKSALILVDSLMIQLALNQVDTSNRINRPTKPARPIINLPVDTTAIKPLFEDSPGGGESELFSILDTAQIVQKDTLSNENQ